MRSPRLNRKHQPNNCSEFGILAQVAEIPKNANNSIGTMGISGNVDSDLPSFQSLFKTMEENTNQHNNPEDVKPFKLDWKDTEIVLKNKSRHFINRPTAEEVLAYDDKSVTEIPFEKDGSIKLGSDDSRQTACDAVFYDKIANKPAEGYAGEVPNSHKSIVTTALYQRSIFVDDDQNVFGEQVTVTEILGDDDNPTAKILHTLKQPDDSRLTKMKNVMKTSKLVHDRRGRQKMVTQSSLRQVMSFYRDHLVSIGGATVVGETFSATNREAFINHVDPLIQKAVVEAYIRELTDLLPD